MHVIKTNLVLNCIDITVSGFWSPEHLDDFAQDLTRAIVAFPATGRLPASLYNFTDAAIQPQSVVAKMQAMASSKAFAGRKVALYTEGQLARLQAKRVSEAGSNMRVFDTRADAIAWLMDHEMKPAGISASPQR
jgi:hypothetical protein